MVQGAFVFARKNIGSIIKAVVIACLIVLVREIVVGTGGIKYAYSHLLYVPIILGGFLWGIGGGVAVALLAGAAAAGIPIDTATGEAQETANWLLRAGIFVMVGGLNGLLMGIKDAYIRRVKQMLGEACSLLSNVFGGFSTAISSKDTYTGSHCQRVAHNAYSIGRQLGLPERESQRLYWAGLLHDVGKIGVPDSILNKPGKLTDAEFNAIRKHSKAGCDLVNSIAESLDGIAKGIRHHHERWDGKGYPDCAKGEEIHVFGRIIAVADVFEALTTKRPYRDALPIADALQEIRKGRGTHFDPLVVDAFLAAYKSGQIWVGESKAAWCVLPTNVDEEMVKGCLHCRW